MLCRLRFSTTIVAFVLIVLAGIQVVVPAEKAEANDKTKKLFEKRVAIRTQILRLVISGYQQGSDHFDQVLQAQTSLLSARLDLCATKEQRIEIHDEMVKVAETSLELAKKRFQAGQAPQVDVLKGEAQLLEMQIGRENVK